MSGISSNDKGFHGMDQAAVQMVLNFQATGRGFDAMWAKIGPAVEGMVRGQLQKRMVKGHEGGVDDNAVAESTQHVMIKLWELPGKGPQAWFKPGLGQGGVDGLRGWLFGFSRHAVAAYCETWRKPRRKCSIVSESSLPVNEFGEAQSLMKRAVAKIDVHDRELEQIVNECVAALSEQTLRDMIHLNFWEELSERDIENHTKTHVSTVHRRLTKARKLLKTALEARGVDASWLVEAA